ncbi:hypothetical protein HQ585_18255 [candidate division KSB1 bacterium]|nr:hypothetical protein [candidate division KSB1 bacterium]
MIPKSLRIWFVIHFIMDVITGLPLLIAPVAVLTLLGWRTVDPIATRLVGAALLGIGIESFLGRNAGLEAYRGMLNLKIIWSATALAGFVLSIITTTVPPAIWLFIGIFAIFHGVWICYRIKINSNHSS